MKIKTASDISYKIDKGENRIFPNAKNSVYIVELSERNENIQLNIDRIVSDIVMRIHNSDKKYDAKICNNGDYWTQEYQDVSFLTINPLIDSKKNRKLDENNIRVMFKKERYIAIAKCQQYFEEELERLFN